MFESVLGRPRNLGQYGEPDVADLAAGYAYGLVRNRPFVDGNKRAAFLAAGLFLYLNGHRLAATQADATVTMLALAAGDMGESDYAPWLRQHLRPKT